MQNRDEWLADTVVELTDTLVPSLDPAGYWLCVADRYAELIASSSVRLTTVGDRAFQPIVVSTDERLEMRPLGGILADEGPAIDCQLDGRQLVNVLLGKATSHWRRLAPAALSLGFRSIHAFPFSRHDEVLGSVTILTTETAPLPDTDVRIAGALADVATIGMLNHRAIAGLTETSQQLQGALNSRVIIEQAKGLLSARLEIAPDEAFVLLRRYARGHNQRLTELSEELVSRRRKADDLLVPQQKRAGKASA